MKFSEVPIGARFRRIDYQGVHIKIPSISSYFEGYDNAVSNPDLYKGDIKGLEEFESHQLRDVCFVEDNEEVELILIGNILDTPHLLEAK